MHLVELLTVEDTFDFARPGAQMLVLSPTFMMPDSWNLRGWNNTSFSGEARWNHHICHCTN